MRDQVSKIVLRRGFENKKNKGERIMKKKKILALFLVLAMSCSMMACSKKDDKQSIAGDTNNDGQIDMGTEDDVEVDEENKGEHLDSFEASTSGKWEAMFTPVEMEGRAIDMANFDLTPTKEELEAMKKEPAYGQKVLYYMADGCTAGPTVAAHLGY